MIHRFKVDKLIRDKLPELMRQSGIKVFERVMEKDEYLQRLQDKLIEEAKEVINARCPKEILEELGDLLEVMRTMARLHGIAFEDVLKASDQKRSDKGGFNERLYNAFVEIDEGNPTLDYYRARPDQYPEILRDITEDLSKEALYIQE